MKTIKNNFWAAVVTVAMFVIPAAILGINPVPVLVAAAVLAFVSK